jgi:dolichol-phosphate mannosyltransferase
VIPAYNEEENLPTLLEDLEQTLGLLGSGSRILIVDDGSEDATAAIVAAYAGPLPVELIRLERNSGPGAAFRTGFAAALELAHTDALIVTLEADTTSDLGALAGMIERARGRADVVLADWQMVNVSAHRRLLSSGAGFVVRHALGLQSNTVSSFFRVYRASTLRRAHEHFGDKLIREEGFACKAELLGKLSSLGACVEEVPVELDWSRRAGESKMPVFRTMLGYWRMLLHQRGDTRDALAQEAVVAPEAVGAPGALGT